MLSFSTRVPRYVPIRLSSPPRKLPVTVPNVRSVSDQPKSIFNSNTIRKCALATAGTSIGFVLGVQTFNYLRRTNDPTFLNVNDSERSLKQRFNFIDKVVQKCAGSVVYVEIKDTTKVDAETNQPLTSSNGSGFIIGEDGWILTNAHVVVSKPHSLVIVMLHDGSKYLASIEDADLNIDLALLKIDVNHKLPFLKMGDSSNIKTGEWVVALGSPLSLSHSATAGVISSANREAADLGLKNSSMRYIQTDAAITFGNSGGPLVNLDGDVVGVNNLRVTAGIAFAIPVDYAKAFLNRSRYLSKPDKVNLQKDPKRYLGIATISINSDNLNELGNVCEKFDNDVTHGVLVWKVIDGTTGHTSGIEAGDIITHVNGFPVYKASDVYDIEPESSKLQFQVVRKGKRKSIIIN